MMGHRTGLSSAFRIRVSHRPAQHGALRRQFVLQCVSNSLVAVGHEALLPLIRKKPTMNPIKIIGIVLIAAGALGLIYGGFSYTKDTTAVKLGPIELTVKEKQSVNVPLWAGIGAIVVGGILLGLGGKGR